MLIARAPLRISLAGGGTDLPAYFERYGGMVVSTTIDKYVYVHLGDSGSACSQITSADYRTFYRHRFGTPLGWDGDLSLPRAVLHEFELARGISIFLASQVPPGTGLGSSSAVAVALLKAVSSHINMPLSRQRLAELACTIELQKLGAPIGKQDQFAAAFGGLNAICFESDSVTVEPIQVPEAVRRTLDRRLLLFFTGTARDSAAILKEQQRSSATGNTRTIQGLHRIKDAAERCRTYLERGDLDGIGALLDEGWRQKKQLSSSITNPLIDEAYKRALAEGAVGGKITGAGGGGFLLIYCHEERQDGLTEALEALGLRRMDFQLESRGASVTEGAWESQPGEAIPA